MVDFSQLVFKKDYFQVIIYVIGSEILSSYQKPEGDQCEKWCFLWQNTEKNQRLISVARLNTVFGGKWKSRIICVLSASKKLRYSEIRKEMYNITDAVLAATLKDLIADGIVDRKSYDEIPPRVEYSLTGKGNSVVPILQSICRWSDIFYKEDVENEMKQCQKCDYHRQDCDM